MTRRPTGPLLLLAVCGALGACALLVLAGAGSGSGSPPPVVTSGSRSEGPPDLARSGLAENAVRATRSSVEEPASGFPGKPVAELGDSRHRGLVLRAEDDQPVAGARVCLRMEIRGCRFPELEPDPILQVTGPDGSFAVPEKGSWELTVRAAQRVTLEGRLQVSDGELSASPEQAVFRLPRGHLVRGRVNGPAGTPPQGTDLTVDWLDARVEHMEWPSAATDEDGWFTLGPMPLGRAFVVVVTTFDTPSFRSLPVRLTEQEPAPIQVPWRAFASLDVAVKDSRGRPAEAVWVELHPRAPRHVFQEDVWEETDERGRVAVRGLALGAYRLQVTHWDTDEVLHEQPLEVTAERLRFEELVQLDRPVADPSERLPPIEVEEEEAPGEDWQEVAVRARFLDETGRELSVTLMPLEEVDGVTLGFWEVEVEPDFVDESRDERLDVRDATTARVLVAAPGLGARLVPLDQVAGPGTVTLDAGRIVRGRLRTQDGRPIPFLPLDAAPWVLHQADEWAGREAFVRRVWADEQGDFEFQNLTREKLVLRVGTEEFDGWVMDEKILPSGAGDVDVGVLVIPGW